MPKTRPIQRDDLFKMKAVGKVAISPCGGQAVYELKRFDLEENKNFVNLVLSDLNAGTCRDLTQGDHNDTQPAWSPDGRHLAFISSRDKVACLYVLPMTGGEARRVTDLDHNVSDFEWSPDSKRFAYTATELNEQEKLTRDGKEDELPKRPQFKHITRLHHKLDGAGWWNGHYAHVNVIPAKGGKPKQLTRGDFDHSGPRWSPDGKLIVLQANREPNFDREYDQCQIYGVKPTGGTLKRLTTGPGGWFAHSFSPDGQTLALIGHPGKAMQYWKYDESIWLVDVKGGKPRHLTREIDNECNHTVLGDVAGGTFENIAPIWAPDGQSLYFVVTENGSVHLYNRSINKRDAHAVFDGAHTINQISHNGDGKFALNISEPTNPADMYTWTIGESAPHRVTAVNADLFKRIDIPEPEPFSVKSGQATVHGWIIKPPKFDKRRKYPTILEVHGGPHGAYGNIFFHELQWLAAQGYVVCYANPRGSSSYGYKHRMCIRGDWGNLDWKDISKVADWLFRRPFVNSKNVGITGGSYGGYMTNWAVAHTNRFKAAVTQRCVSNFESMFGTSDYGYELGDMFGGLPWTHQKDYRRQSPQTFVNKVKTPLLIIHSEQDLRCPIEQAEQVFTALKLLNVDTEFVRFEGESHGLSRGGRPQNRRERLKRILDWFERYLK
jgi:dipeptidyl aminopeptidase/acylaminoacyl peptidase